MKNEQTQQMTQRQIKSFLSSVAKASKVDRAFVKQDFNEAEDKKSFTLDCVNKQMDRKLVFIPILLDGLDKLAVFKPETYVPVHAKMKELHLLELADLHYNTILAIYDNVSDMTWFGFSAQHEVVSIVVDDVLALSPFLPFQ